MKSLSIFLNESFLFESTSQTLDLNWILSEINKTMEDSKNKSTASNHRYMGMTMHQLDKEELKNLNVAAKMVNSGKWSEHPEFINPNMKDIDTVKIGKTYGWSTGNVQVETKDYRWHISYKKDKWYTIICYSNAMKDRYDLPLISIRVKD